ncbi:MAG TPA: glycosyltransferase family 4 protein [Candidatus Hydrogenedentes bacterium]|nr:glycosyltransferase family 4 protein [Candidatus Hydrogenedentota bacterium]
MKVAFLGDYVPRKCGIATFTADLRNAVAAGGATDAFPVVAVTDPGRTYAYPPEVRFEIPQNDVPSYVRAADFLNVSHIDVLCVQHEFGIYGGEAGAHLIALLRRAYMPTVTTLHTILEKPNAVQARVFSELVGYSDLLVTMAEKGRQMLQTIYGVPPEKIVVIPHGIPDMPFVDPNFYKDQFGLVGRPVLLTFGLLSPDKGIEYAIEALPAIVEKNPGVLYIILGATHPNLVREQGETYRLSLERQVRRLGMEEHVMFVNRYVTTQELCEFIGAADIYLTPYLNEAQITSGTLAYCFGAGKVVISTPYWHAAELLADGRGILVNFGDSAGIAEAVNTILADEPRRLAMRKEAYMLGRSMIWSQVARAYLEAFEKATVSFIENRTGRKVRVAATLSSSRSDLPPWRFDHLDRMTDSTGTFQHAAFSLPWFDHGYCTDDNARTLILTCMLEQLDEPEPVLVRIQTAAAAFLHHAFDPKTGRFRNFMSFDRRWLEETGSEDCHGRALWGLGTAVGRTRRPGLKAWAAASFEKALPVVAEFTSPRAWAFTILGLHEYLRTFEGDLLANRMRAQLGERLFNLFKEHRTPDWPWCEEILSYENARLPEALIMTGRWTNNPQMLECGLESLRWLMENQISPAGHFRPIGSNGFWRKGQEEPARFDQQPIETAAAISACLEAFAASGDGIWRKYVETAFDWFLGGNDLGISLYDPGSGGCFDGLQESRVNQNQGAESTLAFLISLAHMHLQLDVTAIFGPEATAR